MTVGQALTVIEIVVITISVVFVLTQLLIRAVVEGRIEESASDLFVSLLYVDMALIGSTTAAGVHVVRNSGLGMTIAVGFLMIAISVLGYASMVSIIEISGQIGAGVGVTRQKEMAEYSEADSENTEAGE